MKYAVITVCERDIADPIIFNDFRSAQEEMEKQIKEFLDGENIDVYGEIGKNYAFLDDVYGMNYDIRICEIR